VIAYDEAAHQAARKATQQTEPERLHLLLENALAALPDLETEYTHAEALMVNRQQNLANHQAESDQLAEQGRALEAAKTEYDMVMADFEKARKTYQDSRDLLVVRKQALAAIENARKRRLELTQQRDDIREERDKAKLLQEAFGKKGVPAMIIEKAIPELEEMTNLLLARMTDGRMHIAFKTQRENRNNTVAETLDVEISDELGTRPYSLYSGGEAFRINFALRVALSQFLARRAGARLQTLIIDEGFGSQDGAGRERLVEAINTIQSDFDLILVVTHIEELRDAFPAVIEVRKTEKGAQVSVR
jgi:DNA repair protein SbcC/Rad50